MRDKRFVVAHRGGPLTKEHHHELIRWARECSEHVLPLIDRDIDKRLTYALDVAKDWEKEKITVGEARKAALGTIAVANDSSDPIIVAVVVPLGMR